MQTAPDASTIARAIRHLPRLSGIEVTFLSEGWEFWAYRAGDYVVRMPRPIANLHRVPEDTTNLDSLRIERSLLPELSRRLHIPCTVIEHYIEDAIDGLPVVLHRFVPGQPIPFAQRPGGSRVGKDVGQLINDLTSFPAERAVELGVPVVDGVALREQRARQYERVIRTIFPLISCEARVYVEQVYETYLESDLNFAFEPLLVHQDLDMNVLVDPDTREVSGVIDFGGAVVSSPGLDWWLPLFGFARLGIANQLDDCIKAAGLYANDVESMRPEVEFIDAAFPIFDMLAGLERDDEAQVEEGLRNLNAALPRNLKC